MFSQIVLTFDSPVGCKRVAAYTTLCCFLVRAWCEHGKIIEINVLTHLNPQFHFFNSFYTCSQGRPKACGEISAAQDMAGEYFWGPVLKLQMIFGEIVFACRNLSLLAPLFWITPVTSYCPL